ncbi:MAG TPA: hypothetical protein VKA46_31015 [Gemmataceae bacterium]|nr:hypothetical protein [Gemmataceae bacterium]
MKRSLTSRLIGYLALGLVSLAPLSLVAAEEKTVNVTVTAGVAAAPPVSITLHERHGHVTPCKGKCTHTGGGLIDVAQPSPDTVLVTMSGAVIANSEMKFDLEQCFEVTFDDPKLKHAKLLIEGRVIGVLRGGHKGSAEYSDASAGVSCPPAELVGVSVPTHSVSGCESLSVNDHDGPKAVPIVPGKYTLHQSFCIAANTSSFLCKRPSAEFSPESLDPLWISYYDPFHGVKKDSFGFQVIVKVVADNDVPPPPKEKAAAEVIPAPVERKAVVTAKPLP